MITERKFMFKPQWEWAVQLETWQTAYDIASVRPQIFPIKWNMPLWGGYSLENRVCHHHMLLLWCSGMVFRCLNWLKKLCVKRGGFKQCFMPSSCLFFSYKLLPFFIREEVYRQQGSKTSRLQWILTLSMDVGQSGLHVHYSKSHYPQIFWTNNFHFQLHFHAISIAFVVSFTDLSGQLTLRSLAWITD